ncbi:MAG TPA: ABC transporter substrate-binding protein [Alphaproteobacteria bacterium]|nr:ABC transporter substrate-binding protein [Alphaproteobacteria bacterium]
MDINRREFLESTAAAAGAAVLVAGTAGAASKALAAEGDVINIGFLAALSGPDAGWGLPGLTGLNIWIDEINAAGGLDVGGKKMPLELFAFDDEAIGSKALQGAKQLVLERDVKIIAGIGGIPADATHPFLTEKKVFYSSLISPDIKPDRPYLIAGGDVTPRIDMLRPYYHRFKDPSLKRWAVVSQDDTIGLTCQAWEVGAALADGWDVVYEEHYALDTTDFAPVVTAILAETPDVVSLNLSYPTFVTQLIEQLYLQGFKGIISANYLDTESILQKVPVEYLEGATDSFPLFDDPWWGSPSYQHDFIAKWMARYGPGAPEDEHREITGIDWDHLILLKAWAEGVQLAGSLDPDAILETMRKQESIDSIIGPAKMIGKDMWGLDNMLSPPVPICEVRGGIKRIEAQVRFEEWFASRKDKIVEVVDKKGQMYYQRA